MWDTRKIKVKDSLVGLFSVSINIEGAMGDWWLTGIYGPNLSSERGAFWEELAGLGSLCSGKWCLGGDFNVVRYVSEKSPQGRRTKSMKDFDEFIRGEGLKDAAMDNARFTWSNGREDIVKSRIDRFLYSGEWEEAFPQVRQEVGLRICSDHFPLILDTNKVRWGPTPFRFENMWLDHPRFKIDCKEWWESVVVSGWEGVRLVEKLKKIKKKLWDWNKDVFGDIKVKKMDIMERIRALDDKEESEVLVEGEIIERRGLRNKLQEVSFKEAVALRQKMKFRWVKEWDYNTSLFHRLVNSRKNMNAITRLEKEDGTVLEDENEIQREIVDFYKDLFQEKEEVTWSMLDIDWDPIPQVKAQWIERRFEIEEVKAAVFGCDRNKSPGSDGFSFGFFQESWEFIKGELMGFLNEFYDNGIVNSSINHTIISLIPKKTVSRFIKDFRPISLVTGVYKILAKILANRLREVLGETISPAQGAFVKDRQILDVILVANEAVEEYRAKKKKGVILKVDFEKAYDHVRWSCLDNIMECKGFGGRWRRWIRGCVSSVNFSIMINGRPRGRFRASRGLRQGDPLSPFLFTMVVDMLGRIMDKGVERDLVKGFSIGRDGVSISHLQFADDTLFLLDDTRANLGRVNALLRFFSECSGLKINMDKSSLVGINIGSERVMELADQLGCSVGSWPMTYLGLPLGGNPMSLEFWNPVVEKMHKRLDGWRKGFLSRGGRVMLVQSVLSNLPTYYMSVFKLPGQVADLLEKLMRNFLWDAQEDGKARSLVAWKTVQEPKERGGLGLGNLRKRNVALLGKWLWRFPLERRALWARIITSKYGLQPNGWDAKVVSRGSLRNPWKFISQGYGAFSANISFTVGEGSRVRFWQDHWLQDGPLQVSNPRIFSLTSKPDAWVSEVIRRNEAGLEWDFRFRRPLSDWEAEELGHIIQAVQGYPYRLLTSDSRVWNGSKESFSCKSFFGIINHGPQVPFFQEFISVWKFSAPHRVKVFSWLLVQGRLNTSDMIQRRNPHIALSPSWCSLCRKDYENIDHLMLHCEVATKLWNLLCSQTGILWATPRECKSLFIEAGGGLRSSGKAKVLWKAMVLSLTWSIWKERNARIFEEKDSNVQDIFENAKYNSSLWAATAKEFKGYPFSLLVDNWKDVLQS